MHRFRTNAFAPRWLPEPLRHPLMGYLVAVLLEVAAATVMLLLLLFPSFAFRGVLTDVVVVLLALGWGAGPSLFATLVGTFLLYYAVLPPHFTWSLANPPGSLGLADHVDGWHGSTLTTTRAQDRETDDGRHQQHTSDTNSRGEIVS